MNPYIKRMMRPVYVSGRKIGDRMRAGLGKNICVNVNQSCYERNCLLIYITAPFIQRAVSEVHQNMWQVKELAKIIGDCQYNVDVVDYNDPHVKLKHRYDMVIGLIPRDIDIYSQNLNPGAIRIAYLTSSNIAFTNAQEKKRLQELYVRRGVELIPRRQGGEISREIESFDAAMFIGNEYNLKTYGSFKMPPVYYIRNNGYAFDFETDWGKKSPRKFLFFASGGQVHKGLDLLLELFAKPDFPGELFICSSFEREEDFCKEYRKELFETCNIHAIGFVDIESTEFKNIVDECAYMIMPSCAEATAGSVLTAMSAGLIPIVSRECGYDEGDVILLDDCRPETIERFVVRYSHKNAAWLKEKSTAVKHTVGTKYSRKNYIQSVKDAFDCIITEREKNGGAEFFKK